MKRTARLHKLKSFLAIGVTAIIVLATLLYIFRASPQPVSKNSDSSSLDHVSLDSKATAQSREVINKDQFNALPPEKLELAVQADETQSSNIQRVALAEDNIIQDSMDLCPSAFIELQLICPNGQRYNQPLDWVLQGRYDLFQQGELDKPEANGLYRIPENPQSYETLSVVPKGYQTIKNIDLKSLGFSEKKEIARTTLYLKAGELFRASIKNSQGEAIAGANCGLFPQRAPLDNSEGLRDQEIFVRPALGESDGEGKVILTGLEQGAYLLKIQHDDYLPQSLPITIGVSPASEMAIVLLSGLTIKVGVKNEAGEVMPNIGLIFEFDANNLPTATPHENDFIYSRRQVTGSDGTCVFSNLQVGKYFLALQEETKGWAEKMCLDIQEPSSPLETVWLILKKGESLGGRVIDENSAPVPNLDLSLVKISSSDSDYVYYELSTQSEGQFLHESLQPGEYELTITGALYHLQTPSGKIKVKSGQRQLEIRVKKTPILKGRVETQDGQALLDYTLVAKNPLWGGMSEVAMVKIHEDGSFETPVPCDPQDLKCEINLLAKSNRHGLSQEISFEALKPPQDPLVFVIQKKACLVVDLVDDQQRALSGLEAWCYPLQQAKKFNPDLPMYSNEKGRLLFPLESNAELRLRIFGGGRFFADKILTLFPLGRDEANPLTVIMTPGAKLKGLALDRKGQPARHYIVELRLKDEAFEPRYIESLPVQTDGSFSFRALPAGTYGLFAKREGHLQQLENDSEEIKQIHLSDGEEAFTELAIQTDPDAGAILGKVSGLSTKDNAWGVSLIGLGNGRESGFSLQTQLDAEYKFSFDAVPPGKYNLSVQGERFNICKELNLLAGQRLDVELEMKPSMLKAEVLDSNGQGLDYGSVLIYPKNFLKNKLALSSSHLPPQGVITQGKLELKGVEPGNVDMLFFSDVSSRTIPPYLLRNVFIDEHGADLGVVKMPAGKLLTLTLQNSFGEPLAGARGELLLIEGDYLPMFALSTPSNLKGQLELCIPTDTAEIIFSAPEFSSIQLPLAQIDQTVVLPPAGPSRQISIKEAP